MNKLKWSMLFFSMVSLTACGTTEKNQMLGAAAFFAATSPSSDILQTYYLGVFDPTEQLPQTIYRIRVRGQAAMLNGTKFASGWVPATFIDTLGNAASVVDMATNASWQKQADRQAGSSENSLFAGSQYRDRRFVMFGPEGLREAPKDHRLVIVMGSSPKDFFSAVDAGLGEIAASELSVDTDQLSRHVMNAMLNVRWIQRELTKPNDPVK